MHLLDVLPGGTYVLLHKSTSYYLIHLLMDIMSHACSYTLHMNIVMLVTVMLPEVVCVIEVILLL